jgi:hypothetical protein
MLQDLLQRIAGQLARRAVRRHDGTTWPLGVKKENAHRQNVEQSELEWLSREGSQVGGKLALPKRCRIDRVHMQTMAAEAAG